ncbi:conserved unknown protein [Ectocarpus siliculosus]|uniref:C2 domain-containing protein n=1 Tax=Ectocarpus siliculosus TaxID=2880 RepID=D8LK92_ECTSI|nr:conserved unknown protein [Ectocarpus siliculosus]|eukprot:CBN79626.1 conserved unknown protein [Ectocarpus siliculosus]
MPPPGAGPRGGGGGGAELGLGGGSGPGDVRGEAVTSPERAENAGPRQSFSGASSSLPREKSHWELGSDAELLPGNMTPTNASPMRDNGDTKDLSGSAGASSLSGTGNKDLSRFGRARKAVKKRTKEMDAGAAHLRSMLSGHLGPDFEQVISLRRMQMRVKIFLRRSLLDVYDHEEGESAAENTGIGKVVANKGGLVCKLRLRGTTLCFVSCHLQAHEGQNHLARRNSSCAEILQGARLGDRRMVDVDSQFHHVFWLGDMNYRINLGLGLQPEEQHARVSALVEASDWPRLWEADELLKELRAGRLLAGFQGIRGETSGYSAKRIPSYTDRILWKSLPGHAANLDLLKFTSFPEITSSDHKPIHAAFVVKLTPEVGAPPLPNKMFGRRARMPLAVLDVPRMAQHPPPRLLLEDLEVFDLQGIAGGGVRNPYVVFSSDPKHLVKASPAGKPPKTTVKKKTLRAKWNRYAFQLAISDPVLLRQSHVSLVVMDKERGRKSKGEVIGVANLSLAEVLWINNGPPASANARSSSPSSAAAAASAAASSRRRSSLPLRRRSLSPDRARHSNGTRERSSSLEGHGRGGGDGSSGVGGQDSKIGEAASAGEETSSLSSSQQRRGTGMPRHRSHSSLPWGFFRHQNGGLSYREDGDSGHNTAAAAAACGDGGGGGGGHRDHHHHHHHHHHHRRASSGSGGGSDMTSVGCEGQDVAGTSAAARAAAAPGVSPTSTTGTSSRALGGCEPSAGTTADSKEGSAYGGGTGGGGGGGYNRRSSFFHNLAGHHLHHQDEQDGRAAAAAAAAAAAEQRLGPMFDIPLVKSGLHRGRISGRCTLVLGSGTGVNLLRLGSVRALGPGGVASVGGVGVAGLSDGDGSSGGAAAKLRDRASEGGENMGNKAPPGLAAKSVSDRVFSKSRRLRSDSGGGGRDSAPAGCVCM